MSSTAEEWDRRRADAERWERMEARLEEIDKRLASIEKTHLDAETRKRHIREFFEDLGHWLGYLGKLIVSIGVVGGAAIALIAWAARHGG